MLTSSFLEAVNEIEARHPVCEWRIGSVRVWPLIRIRLAHLFFEAVHREAAATGAPGLGRRAVDALRGYARYGSALLRDRRGNASVGPAPAVVFLSDGVSYTTIGGRAYEKYCDPLIERLGAVGVGSLLLSPLANYRVPRHTPSVFVQPRLDRMAAAAWLVSKARLRPLPMHLPGFDEATRELHALMPLPAFGRAELEPRVRYLEAMARYFEGVLARVRPSAAFVVSYYCLVGHAFNLACRRSGVLSVDLQHGTPGELHPAYCRWSAVPADGFELLPAVFWCWSDADRRAIESSGAPFVRHHRPVAGANLMQDEWIVGRSAAVAECDARVRAMDPSGDPKVLLTLQPGVLTPELLRLLLDVIRRTRDEFAWWVRLHPMMLDQQPEIERWLDGQGALIGAPTELPLYGLLRGADVHMTYSSSTVVEAEAFGVKSVVLSAYGEEFFPDQRRSGTVLFADTVMSVMQALRRQVASREPRDELCSRARSRLARADETLRSLVRVDGTAALSAAQGSRA